MLDQQYRGELRALRDLERAVRAYVLTPKIISERQRTSMLAGALVEVVRARKMGIADSRFTPFEENNE